MFVEVRYPAAFKTDLVSNMPAVADELTGRESLRYLLAKHSLPQTPSTSSTAACAWNSGADNLVGQFSEDRRRSAQPSTATPEVMHNCNAPAAKSLHSSRPSEPLHQLQDEIFNSREVDTNWNNLGEDVPVRRTQTLPQRQESHVTTLMIRHLPRKYMPSHLMWELDHAGFTDQYDYLYIPAGSRRHQNRGYAFINFRNQLMGERFQHVFHGGFFMLFSSARPLEIVPAYIQGLADNFQHQMAAPRASSHLDGMSPVFLHPISIIPR